MEILDLLNENAEMFVEATSIGLAPDMSSIISINNQALEESFTLEVAMVSAANRLVLSEGTAVLSEGIMGNIFDKIKSIIMKMWAKIKEFFKRVKLFFDKLVMKESKFASTYKNEILKITSAEVEGYEVALDGVDVKTIASKLETKIESFKNKDNKTSKEMLDDASQAAIGSDADGFKKEVESKLGLDSTTTVKYSGGEIFNILSGLNKAVAAVSKEESEVNTSYNSAIKNVEKLKKEAEERAVNHAQNKDKDTVAGHLVKVSNESAKLNANKAEAFRSALGLVNIVAGCKITALKTQAAQAKKAAYKGMTKKEEE